MTIKLVQTIRTIAVEVQLSQYSGMCYTCICILACAIHVYVFWHVLYMYMYFGMCYTCTCILACAIHVHVFWHVLYMYMYFGMCYTCTCILACAMNVHVVHVHVHVDYEVNVIDIVTTHCPCYHKV